jgi:hypothetical protein
VLNSTVSPYSGYNCVSKNCYVNFGGSIGVASQISVGQDGSVYATDQYTNLYKWDSVNLVWDVVDRPNGNTDSVALLSVGANGLIAIVDSAGKIWTLNGTTWTQISANTGAVNVGMDAVNHLWAVYGASMYFWNGSSWVLLNLTAVNFSMFADGACAVDLNDNVWMYDYDSGGWTEVGTPSSLGFTPRHIVGTIACTEGGDVAIIDTSNNLHVSQDYGNTFTTTNRSGFTPVLVTAGDTSTIIVTDSTGDLWHLNDWLAQTTVTITGSCTASACSSNPTVNTSQWSYAANADSTSFIGTSGGGGTLTCATWGPNAGPYCEVQRAVSAHTVLNQFVSAASTTCDSFAPGTNNKQCEVNLALDVALVTPLIQTSQDCKCGIYTEYFNQKYKVISNNINSAPDGAGWFGTALFGGGVWFWPDTNLLQWCSPVVKPTLSFYGAHTLLTYKGRYTKPGGMFGQYVNGDVLGWAAKDGSMVGPGIDKTGALPTLFVFLNAADGKTYGTVNGGIYTWNSTDTDYRGPAGQPTNTCQGQ